MDHGHLFRRMFHLCAPAILVYYLLPGKVFGVPREAWVLAVLLGLLVIEAMRLFTGRAFFGLREYEKGQLSAFAWAGIGVTIAFLFFPMPFVVCAVFGLAWTDPLIGEMRRRKLMRYYPGIPLIIYFCISASCLLAISGFTKIQVVILSIVGSIVAISVEKPKLPIDDDFLMLVVPLAAVTIINWYMNFTGLV